MRVISGLYRGRILRSPADRKTRPTSDRLRETLFNVLSPRISEETRFLDLCAGTGAIGIGLILLGLNAARSLNGIAVSGFSTTLGILVLLWGGLELAGAILPLPFELPVFAILLITLGVLLLGGEIVRPKN